MAEPGSLWRRLQRRRDVLLYLTGGVLSALIDVGLMQALLVAGAGVTLATSAGFGVSLLFNYAFHARYTFGNTRSASAGGFGRYLSVVALNYGLTLALVQGAVALGLAPMAGKLVALPLVAVVGFVLGKLWIFKKAQV